MFKYVDSPATSNGAASALKIEALGTGKVSGGGAGVERLAKS